MKPKKIEQWEKTRQMGSWKYAFIFGSIWGFFVTAFVFLANYFTWDKTNYGSFSSILIMLLIYWVTGIILYRFIIWNAKERVYKKWLNQQNQY